MTLDQCRDQFKEQDEVTSHALYDLRTLFQEAESSTVIPEGQITEDDQAENMPLLVTSNPSLEEQM